MTRLAGGELELEIPDQDRRDEIGAMARAVQVFKEDMAKRQRLTSQIAHLAHHDTLTGLPNRVLFHETLERALADPGEPVALHCLDLDQFKAVKDSLGHHIGDRLLQAAARRLCRGSHETDTVARLGGDEFAIVQTGMNSPTEVTGLATRLIELLSEPFEIDGHHIVVGVSVGTAFAPRDAAGAEKLLKCADMALYRAKDDGRGVYRLFEHEMDTAMQARRILECDLRQALQAGQLELHYQPLVDLAERRTTGCEALLRWRHPTRGLLPPGRVRASGRGNRPDRADRGVGAGACVRECRRMAAGDEGRGQPLGDPAAQPAAGDGDQRCPARLGAGADAARAGDHRNRAAAGYRDRTRRAAPAA
jgi:diguanylate cyclase (GGDEF)-like protein